MKLCSSTLSYILVGLYFFLSDASCAQSVTPFSQYGTIQNVQSYSSNPFWSPNSGYGQRVPQPVYATGPSIETSQCQIVVFSLITAQCASLNNCISTQLSDIRPAIMLQLSRMPGGNYATSCSGYIDTLFEEYKQKNAIAQPNIGGAFPNAIIPNPNAAPAKIELPNQPVTPDWKQDMQERRQELKDLQVANGNNVFEINPDAEFPTTYANLSFTERMANDAVGYEQYQDKKAFTELKIESQASYDVRNEKTSLAQKRQSEKLKEDLPPQSNKPILADNELDILKDEILFYL